MKLKLNFATKLLCSYIVILVMTLIVGIIGYYSMKTMAFQTEISNGVSQIVDDLSNARLGQADYMITGDDKFITKNKNFVEKSLGSGNSIKKKMELMASRDEMDKIADIINRYQGNFKEYTRLTNKQAKAFEVCIKAEQKVFAEIKVVSDSINTFFTTHQEDFDEFGRFKDAAKIDREFLWVLVLFNRYTADKEIKNIEEADKLLAGILADIPILKDKMLAQETKKALDNVAVSIKNYAKGMHDYSKTIQDQKNSAQAMLQHANEATEHVDALSQTEKGVAYKAETKGVNLIVIVTVIAIVLSLVMSMVIIRAVTRPLKQAVKVSDLMAQGDLTQQLDIKQDDEIGALAKALNNMSKNLRGMFGDIASGTQTLADSSDDLAQISNQISSNSQQTEVKVGNVSSAAQEMAENMDSIAAATEQAAGNIQMVVAASEEMSATINEISKNTSKGSETTAQAVKEAENVSGKVEELGVAASEINKVTETISDISEQTNLLALNATIEAARAGEAGKGFAVVAGEIKALAQQTAQATSEISSRIGGVQTTTREAITAIESIVSIIDKINIIVTSVAGAIEEQAATTQEISNNVSQAAAGIQEVNDSLNKTSVVAGKVTNDISEVNRAAEEMSTDSGMVNTSASKLGKLADDLSEMVERFKI